MSLQAAKSSPGVVPQTGKKNRKQKRKANGNAKRVAKQRAQIFHLSPCSEHYLTALLDPFDLEGGLACIPDLLDFPSFKCLAISRGTFNIGTGQMGFVVCNPLAESNNTITVISSTAAYTDTELPALLPTTGVTQTAVGQFPYDNSSFGIDLRAGRTVGCGVRVRYTGTELNRSGRAILVRLMSTAASLSSATVADLLERSDIPSIAINREWINVCYLPTTESDYEYGYGNGEITVDLEGATLGIVVDGAVAGNGFEYEIYWHKEYKNNGPYGLIGATPSHSDIVGLSAVRNTVQTNVPVQQPKVVARETRQRIKKYTPEDSSGFTFSGLLDVGADLLSGDYIGAAMSGLKMLA
jgi:hypothetical protein